MATPNKSAKAIWASCVKHTVASAGDIDRALQRMAVSIAATHRRRQPTRPLVVVSILKGGALPGVELVRRLGALGVACRVDFLWLASYTGTGSTGRVSELAPLQTSVAEEHVLLVDDLIDTGLTLAHAREVLLGLGPASVETAVLLEKVGVARHPRARALAVDHLGLRIPDRFVVGAYMDCDEHFRSLPDIVELDRSRLGRLRGGLAVGLAAHADGHARAGPAAGNAAGNGAPAPAPAPAPPGGGGAPGGARAKL